MHQSKIGHLYADLALVQSQIIPNSKVKMIEVFVLIIRILSIGAICDLGLVSWNFF